MVPLSTALTALVARRHGIVTRAELLADGVTTDAVRRAVTAGALVPVHRSTYRVATSPDTLESRCAAASLADPHAVVTGPAAASLWHFRHVRRPIVPTVLLAHDRTTVSSSTILRRTNVLESCDVVERDDGIRVASPERTWFDCARDLDDRRFEALTEWVIDHHCSVPRLWHTLRRLQGKGRTGVGRVRRVLSQRATWQRPAGSGLELRVLTALEAAGLPTLVRQHPIRLRDGSLVHPDGAVPPVRWAIEVDHVTWHGGRADAQYDKMRDRRLRRIGWTVERVTDQELADDFDGAIAEIVDLYRHHTGRVA